MRETAQQNPQANNLRKHKVLEDFVLVLPLEFSESGPVLDPRQYEDKPEWGIVLGLGEYVADDKFKVGDVVCFGQYASITVRSHGVDFFFIKADEIMSTHAL